MILLENVLAALSALRANGMRSALTTLGIVIGVAAVIAVVAVVQGFQHMITKELEGVGSTYIFVLPKQTGAQGQMVAKRVTLTWDDGRAIEERVEDVDRITPALSGSQVIKHADRSHRTSAVGVDDDWPAVNNHFVERGRFFSHIDLRYRRKVAVIGKTVAEELQLGSNPVGEEVYIGRMPVTIIGIMEERGQSLGQDSDDTVFVPFNTAKILFGRKAAEQIQLQMQAKDAESVERVREGIRTVLRSRHGLEEGEPDDFQILVQDEILKTTSSILGGVTAVVGAVVGISLLVGGIGIMNILLVSVTERTREIGLRKALGARRSDILMQFLTESILLSLVGGAVGIVFGYAIGFGASQLLPEGWSAAYVPLWAIGLAFGFCLIVGVFFGIYPAAKASRLDPIEALRYE